MEQTPPGASNAAPAGSAYERRIVSVLFADLVGFTTLSEELDAEDVAAIQDRYFAAVRETVDRHGGVVEKFIGDAAMAAFGIPRTHDDDPERAVLAGLAIAAAVDRLNAPLGLAPDTLAVRVGIATGEVAYAASGTNEGRLTGDTVNTAARLQTAAPRGRVLVNEATALAVAQAVDLAPAEALTLKGKAEPIRAALVRALRPAPSREAAMADLRAPTLGRETELALLAGALDRVRRGESTETWLVVAAPGTGKTRLLDEFAAAVAAAGRDEGHVAVLRARFGARDSRPFGALADLARSALESLGRDGAESDARGAGVGAGGLPVAAPVVPLASVAALVPVLVGAGIAPGRAEIVAASLAGLAGTGEPEAGAGSRDARFGTWLAGLDGLSGGQPSVWLLEDLHWAGPDAVAFLELARNSPAPAGRLLVATSRPGFLEASAGWAEDDPARGRRLLELRALPAATTASLIEALVGPGTLPSTIVERIAGASDGNCLFVEELLRLWVSAGLLSRTDGRWTLSADPVDMAVPTTVQAVYAAQLDELPPEARHAVRRGAVAGRRVAPAWLDRAGVPDVPLAVRSLRARRLLDGPVPDPLFGDAYVYRHALLRDAAYASLARADRAALHVRFARWLESASGDADAVAELLGDHLEAALDAAPALAREVAPDVDRETASREAAHWLERAAEGAIRAGAREHAVRVFARSLARTPEDDAMDLARRERRLGEATADAGRMPAAAELLAHAADRFRVIFQATAEEPVRSLARSGLAGTANSLARVLHEQLLFQESAATADGVLAEIGDADDLDSAWLRLRGALARGMWSDSPADVVPTATAVIPVAQRHGDGHLALEARIAILSMSDVLSPEFAPNAVEVARLAHDLGRPDVEARALRIHAVGLDLHGDDPMPSVDAAARIAVNHGLDEALGWAEFARAELAFGRGDWDVAHASGKRALAVAERHGYVRVAVRTWFVLVPIAAARRDLDTLRRAGDWFAAHAAFFPDSPYGRLMHAAVDLHLWSLGLHDLPDVSPDRLLPSFTVDAGASWLEAADVVVRRWIARGELAAAEDAVARMVASGEGPGPVGSAVELIRARVHAARGDGPGAAAGARAAAAQLRSSARPWWVAKALRLVERTGASTDDEAAEAAAIERRLGSVEPAP